MFLQVKILMRAGRILVDMKVTLMRDEENEAPLASATESGVFKGKSVCQGTACLASGSQEKSQTALTQVANLSSRNFSFSFSESPGVNAVQLAGCFHERSFHPHDFYCFT
jgi:hypothetical protein